jgi:hypothetical protein
MDAGCLDMGKSLVMPGVEYVYGSVRALPFWKLLLFLLIASS